MALKSNLDEMVDEFRAVVRAAAAEGSQTIVAFLHTTLDDMLVEGSQENAGKKVLTFDVFENGMYRIKSMRQRITRSDLEEIFEECDEHARSSFTIEELAEFCQRTITRARALALKLRKAILESLVGEDALRRVFVSICGTSKYANVNSFREFAEDMLEMNINDNDTLALYALYDVDGDNKVSLEDFLGFISSAGPTPSSTLDSGNGEVIVDIKVSTHRDHEIELARQGYSQIPPPELNQAEGTFGNKTSMWVWRRKQGTASGKLKPITDIQLDATANSSAMVLCGYVCLTIPLAGQWVWIKRAENIEEEKDGIVDIVATLGNMSQPVNKIWSSPGVGWIRVDGNFAKGILKKFDAFVWFLPGRTRSTDTHMASPVRSAVFMAEDTRHAKLLDAVVMGIRGYISLNDMKEYANPQLPDGINRPPNTSATVLIAGLFHQYERTPVFSRHSGKGILDVGDFQRMLWDIGLRLDKPDYPRLFHFFDIKQDKAITREEFIRVTTLTDYELDLTVEVMREKLRPEGLKGAADVKHKRLLSDIFKRIDENGNGYLSLKELLTVVASLDIFLTEEECSTIKSWMDIDHDDRIEESDFIAFMCQKNDTQYRMAHRIREATLSLRRWLLRGAGLTGKAKSQGQWSELQRLHEGHYNSKFPGYLVPQDIKFFLMRMSIRLSYEECKEVTMLIAPEKSGKVHNSDIQAFIKRECRSFGELMSMLEKDIMKPIMDVYRSYSTSKAATQESRMLQEEYLAMIEEVVVAVKGAVSSKDTEKGAKHDVVSVTQVKDGIAHALRGYETPENATPNLEEWACLAALTSACVTEDDNYGINIQKLLMGLCERAIGGVDLSTEEVMTSDMLCRELQRMIKEEATQSGKKVDLAAAFELFDQDQSGSISRSEFEKTLIKLQLANQVPDGALTAVINKFDRENKGYINIDDFRRFAEESTYAMDMSPEDFEEEEVSLSSNTPPIAITKNGECDWLLWYLWRAAIKIDPSDPESVITELEAACAEIEEDGNPGAVTEQELWAVLFELKLRGDMNKGQFEASVRHLRYEDKTDLVDYESLCRYIIRMGRGYNERLQEREKSVMKLYSTMKGALIKELASLCSAGSRNADGTKSNNLRFEKVFNRLDTDGDGKINVQEFKVGLKRLRVSDEKKWTLQMIRKLFDECDENRDGLLDLKELSTLIRTGSIGTGGKTLKEEAPFLEPDDDDDEIFRKQRVLSDHELFRKVVTVLQDVVPTSSKPGEEHIETIKGAVRRFFQRTDADNRGVVSEERFRGFCRRSTISEHLTPSELRMLIERLRRRRPVKTSTGTGVIDYEKFLRHLSSVGTSSVPLSAANSVLDRIHDAAKESTAAGRPFLGLCSLVDPSLTGYITREELIHTCKMMGCTLSSDDVRKLEEILPQGATEGGRIDYRQVNQLIQTYNAPADFSSRGYPSRAAGASPFYASTPGMRNFTDTANRFDFGDSIATPSGLMVNTPTASSAKWDPWATTAKPGRRGVASSAAYDRQMQRICDKVRMAVEEKNKTWGSFSLQKQFEVYDARLTRFVSLRTFQSTLDDLGVYLSSSDLHAVSEVCGRDDMINYDKFCSMMFEDTRLSDRSDRFYDAPRTEARSAPQAPGDRWKYLPSGSRIAERLRELKAEGRHPLDIFEANDLDHSGMVDVRTFRETVSRLRLLQSEYQINHAIDDFVCISDRNLVCYEDFVMELENKARSEGSDLGSTMDSYPTLRRSRVVDGSGFDGLRRSREMETEASEKWYSTPRSSLKDSLERYDDDYLPKPSESVAIRGRRPSNPKTWSTSSDFRDDSRYRSPVRGSTISRTPRSPPGKVGAVMWGSDTPIHRKGKAPVIEHDHWVCGVCYFTENRASSKNCEMCSSPNYSVQKEFQIKEQCANCTFLNGPFAVECEMCGEKMKKSAAASRR